MIKCRLNPWHGVDVVMYIACLSAALVLGMSLIAPRPEQVSCSDPALLQPYRADTISLALVLLTCVILPAPVIFLTECLTFTPHAQVLRVDATELEMRTGRSRYRESFYSSLSLYRDLVVGMVMSYLLLELLKVGTALPRPNFWDICGADTRMELCGGHKKLVAVDLAVNCSNPRALKWRHLADAAKSFPSGHSCFSCFIALFLTSYYFVRLGPVNDNQRLPATCKVEDRRLPATTAVDDRRLPATALPTDVPRWYGVARRWLPLPWIVWAVVVSCSRLWDHKHHWQDVVGGAVLGLAMAAYTILVISQNFRVTRRVDNHRDAGHELNAYRVVSLG
ncbi:phospholipid phosphatase homolog 1.2 homolog [Hyalella azteca]|uniref:Phospholipid phosphatase homolog 1.2 homolog n=1 Tax=Hyalella azteca TaxID=294128 RepID=A0A8B7PCS7_HYAAZ|nr:phospholipid phosphatase homolog 1.2 homolog [Hyalella azteca]